MTCVIGFAWVTALPEDRKHVYGSQFGWSLRAAANTRATLAPLMFFGPDMFSGMASIYIVKGSAGLLGMRMAERAPGWTYLTTLVQGALVSARMFLLALLIWGGLELFGKGGLKPRLTAQGTS